MQYVYMDNFRGFADTFVPLVHTTFLVGENSTGKSSFLKLVRSLSSSSFWANNSWSAGQIVDLGGFQDIVSANSGSRDEFSFGVVGTGQSPQLTLFTFREHEGLPRLDKYIAFSDGILSVVSYDGQYRPAVASVRYQTPALKDSPTDLDLLGFVESLVGIKPKLEAVSVDDAESTPPYFWIRQSRRKLTKEYWSVRRDRLFDGSLRWIAPIRSKSSRIYDGISSSPSPEGDHAPYVLRKLLTTYHRAHRYAEVLRSFGAASGLFDSVSVHPFGEDPHAPFEVLIQLSGANFNISNVGYGVPQSLPILVDFLSADRASVFAIQQPEVHLHPRAQAALGDLMFTLASGSGHQFIVETHSDYLIDRYRLAMSRCKEEAVPASAVVFFSRHGAGNSAVTIPIERTGMYPELQPRAFKDFFVNEEMDLLGI